MEKSSMTIWTRRSTKKAEDCTIVWQCGTRLSFDTRLLYVVNPCADSFPSVPLV